MHTYLCKHASGTPEEYLARAEQLGLEIIGFSDHIPWPVGYDSEWRMRAEDFPLYREMIEKLQKNSKKIKVRFGIEMDWTPGQMDEIHQNLSKENFDFILGSVHYVDGCAFDNPDFISRWKEKNFSERIWNRYAELLYDFIKEADFDIIAHADLPKKFGYWPENMKDFLKKIDLAFAEAGKKGMAIEINTAGLRKPAKEIYPSLEILKLAKKNGLLLTTGSDAHSPEEVAADFTKAAELAKAAGYTHTTDYKQRKPQLLPL